VQSCRLYVIPQEVVQLILSIAEHCNTSDANHRLSENLNPLMREFGAIQSDTGHVATRAREAPCKAEGYRVGNGGHATQATRARMKNSRSSGDMLDTSPRTSLKDNCGCMGNITCFPMRDYI